MHNTKPQIITETDVDMLAEAANNNCGLLFLMRHHNEQTKHGLELLSHEQTVERETEITYLLMIY